MTLPVFPETTILYNKVEIMNKVFKKSFQNVEVVTKYMKHISGKANVLSCIFLLLRFISACSAQLICSTTEYKQCDFKGCICSPCPEGTWNPNPEHSPSCELLPVTSPKFNIKEIPKAATANGKALEHKNPTMLLTSSSTLPKDEENEATISPATASENAISFSNHDQNFEKEQDTSTYDIIGIVVGISVFIIFIIGVVIFIQRRKRTTGVKTPSRQSFLSDYNDTEQNNSA